MITLAPISKNIQRTLRQKIAMLKKGTGGQVYDKKTDDWIDGNYAFNMPLSTEGKPSISQNYMFARTPWLRMTSFTPMQGTNNTAVVIMGGEVGLSEKIQNIMGTVNNEKDGISTEISTEISTRKTLSGFKDLYRKSGNIPYRPIAGVKDISIEYKGGGMKLGATRTGEINWTCWDWEQLDRLTPHFLHHGKTVLLEWGWSGIGDLKDTQVYPLLNDGTLNFDADKLDKLTEKLLTHIQSQNGHYDAMLGLVQNFDWSVNENGGFDCNTTIISPGVTLLQNKQDDFKSIQKSAIATLVVKGDYSHYTIPGDLKELYKYITFSDYMSNFWNQINEMIIPKIRKIVKTEVVSQKTGQTKKIYKLDDNTNKISDDKLKNQIISTYKFSLKKSSSKKIYTRKKKDWLGNFIDDENGPYVIDYVEASKETVGKHPTYYVTWGWFEDNILSRFFGETSDDKVISAIRSIESTYNNEGNIEYVYSKFTDSNYLMTVNSKKWLIPKINDTVFSKIIKEFGFKEERKSKEDMKFEENKTYIGDGGVEIRKIYFNVAWLAEKLKDKSDIQQVIQTIWDDFSSEYGGVYKFKLDYDDTNSRLVVKEEGYTISNVDEVDELKPYEFPVWQDDSIVKSQTINAKLPDRMKIAAMYGSNPDENETDNKIDSYDIIAAKAWGRMMKSITTDEKNMSEAEKIQKRFADLLTGKSEMPGKENRKFGRIDGDITKPITINSDDGIRVHDKIRQTVTSRAIKEFQELYESDTEDEIEKIEDVGAYKRTRSKSLSYLASGVLDSYGEIYNIENEGSWPRYIIMKPEVLTILQSLLRGDEDGIGKNIQPLIPIEFELEIDGTGGMFPGNSFHSSYLAQRYKEEAVFQMVGVGHKIDSSGWTTSIKGQIRVKAVDSILDDRLIPKNVVLDPKGIDPQTGEPFTQERISELLANGMVIKDSAGFSELTVGEMKEVIKESQSEWTAEIIADGSIDDLGKYTGEQFTPENGDTVLDANKFFIEQAGEDAVGQYFQFGGKTYKAKSMEELSVLTPTIRTSLSTGFGSGQGNYYTISSMAKGLGIPQGTIISALKSKYPNWDGKPATVQVGWSYP